MSHAPDPYRSEPHDAMVSIEGDPDNPTYPARVVGRWNGWAVPAFTLETVRAMAADPRVATEDGAPVVVVAAIDSPDGFPVVLEHDGGDEEGTYRTVRRDGDRFLIGDGWVWLEVAAEDDDDDADDATATDAEGTR